VAIGRSGVSPDHLVRHQAGTVKEDSTGGIFVKIIAITLVLSSALLGLGTLATAQNATPVAPDNSAVNARDRDAGAMTAGQQSNSKSDLELTRKIRRAVVKDDSLSTMAHNVKIITANGGVTLRGPVKTDAEKAAIANIAQQMAGADKVDNQLEVKGPQ
jgi:hyperosmotically inducible protein